MAANVGGVTSIVPVVIDGVVQQGTGYVSPIVELQGGGGQGATAVASVGVGGIISAVSVISAGSGYTIPPTVVITDGAGVGTGAEFEARLNLDSGDPLDFPTATEIGQQYTAENGIAYEVVSLNPTIWRVVDVSANQGQRLWFRNTDDNSIQPIFPGDDVLVIDTAGNATTRIFSGGQQGNTTELPGIKSDNYFFNHLPALP